MRSMTFSLFACLLLAAASILLYPVPGVADPEAGAQLPGFPGATADIQLAIEERHAGSLRAGNLRTWLRRLSSKPHHAGSPGSMEVAQFLAERFRSWGFDTEIETFYALMSTPKECVVEMISPHEFRAVLSAPLIPGHMPEETEGSLTAM